MGRRNISRNQIINWWNICNISENGAIFLLRGLEFAWRESSIFVRVVHSRSILPWVTQYTCVLSLSSNSCVCFPSPVTLFPQLCAGFIVLKICLWMDCLVTTHCCVEMPCPNFTVISNCYALQTTLLFYRIKHWLSSLPKSEQCIKIRSVV